MKTLPAGMQSHLDSGATTLCWCWKLTPVGATAQGFTDHDTDVTFDGVTYEASSGFTASEVDSTLGLAVDNLAVMGALSDAALNEADLAAGRYDNAAIEIWRVNWASPDQRVLMRKGNLGEVKRGRTAFTAEMRGWRRSSTRRRGRVFAFSCDADLGDARCTIDLSDPAFHGTGAVIAASDARRFTVSGLGSFANAWFAGGKLAWTSGAKFRPRDGRKAPRRLRHERDDRAVATDERSPRARRRVHDHRGLRQAVHHLQSQVRQRSQLSRPALHDRQRRRDRLSHATRPARRRQPLWETEIVRLARGWTGTPYVHQASVPRRGLRLPRPVRGVWREMGRDEPETLPNYAPDWGGAGRAETLYRGLAPPLRRNPPFPA